MIGKFAEGVKDNCTYKEQNFIHDQNPIVMLNVNEYNLFKKN
jgi:hypothetical protein